MKTSKPQPCTVEVAIVRSHCETEWRTVDSFPSIRFARDCLSYAIGGAVDYLSSASYDIRLRRADGSIKVLTDKQQDHAIERCKAQQYHDSIGQRLRRGEAVFV